VIVGAEAVFATETDELSRRGRTTSRLSVDVDVDPPVDQASTRFERCPSSTPLRRSRTAALGRFNRGQEASQHRYSGKFIFVRNAFKRESAGRPRSSGGGRTGSKS
jgi:hypothetical protein